MSEISLNKYIRTAMEKSDGTIRHSAKDSDVLVNKGTLGHRIATQLGWGDAKTQKAREQNALTGFRDALTQRYGEDSAGKALKHAGLHEEDGATLMKGGDVMKAADHARELAGEYSAGNRTKLQEGRSEGEAQLDGETAKSAFRQRYHQQFLVETEYGRKELESDDNAKLIQKTVDQVNALTPEDLETSAKLRTDLDQATIALVKAVSSGKSPEVLLQRMTAVDRLIDDLATVEKVSKRDREDWRTAMRDGSLHRALQSTGSKDLFTVLRAQRRALYDDSALRLLYAGAQDVLANDKSRNSEKALAEQTTTMCESLVQGFARRLGPRTTLERSDIERLQNNFGIKAEKLEGAVQVFKDQAAKDRPAPKQAEKLDTVGQLADDFDLEIDAPQDPILLKARDLWLEKLKAIPPLPDDLDDMSDEDRYWAIELRDRKLKATPDDVVAQYMKEKNCDLTTACDELGDLLLPGRTLANSLGFIDQQTLLDAIVDIEDTGILKEGPRRTEVARRKDEVQRIEDTKTDDIKIDLEPLPDDEIEITGNAANLDVQTMSERFFHDLIDDIPDILRNNPLSIVVEDLDLENAIARRIDALVEAGANQAELCGMLRQTLQGMDSVLTDEAVLAIETGINLRQKM